MTNLLVDKFVAAVAAVTVGEFVVSGRRKISVISAFVVFAIVPIAVVEYL